jgi:hypothetical protein
VRDKKPKTKPKELPVVKCALTPSANRGLRRLDAIAIALADYRHTNEAHRRSEYLNSLLTKVSQ